MKVRRKCALEPPAEEDLKAVEASGRRWKELYEQRSEGILTRNLIFAKVLQNKKKQTVLHGAQRII